MDSSRVCQVVERTWGEREGRNDSGCVRGLGEREGRRDERGGKGMGRMGYKSVGEDQVVSSLYSAIVVSLL